MRAWQAALLIVGMGIPGLATGNRLLEVAAFALIVLFVIGLAYRVWGTGDIKGERFVQDAIVAWGQLFTQHIVLHNTSRLAVPSVRVTDLSTLPDHPRGYVTTLGAQKSITWNVEVACRYRGRYQLGPVAVYTNDPIGLFPLQRQIGGRTSILVLPRWVPLGRSGLKLDGFMPGEMKGQRRGESPPNVSSVREYVPGDSVAAIHWRASARTGNLMTRLFDPEVQTNIWVVLDLDNVQVPQVEELLVTVATSLGMFALRQGNLRVGLAVGGQTPVLLNPERGKSHQYRIQEYLAEVHPGSNSIQAQMGTIEQRSGPGHIILLVTAQPPSTWANRLHQLRERGIGVRVAHVVERDGANVGWSIPSMTVPLSLADPERESELITLLEG